MTVKNYYYEHFNELSEEKQLHFAQRMKRWADEDRFDTFLAEHEPSHDLAAVLANNDYTKVRFLEERQPFFEKYQGIFGLEAALFRVLNLRLEYGVDLRDELLGLYGEEQLYALCDALRGDSQAFFVLTTWVVNVLALVEEFYPRGIDIYGEMLEKALAGEQNIMSIYLYTHILLCESMFYTRKDIGHLRQYQQAMENMDDIIERNYDGVSLDMKFEFLVCAKMLGYESRLRERIGAEAEANKDGFVHDLRVGASRNTLDGAEHRNVLYIMSGLDA